MIVQRIDRVVGVELLAVGELDALAQVEHPLLGVLRGLEARGEVRLRLAVLAPFDEAVENAVRGVDHHGIVVAADVPAIGGAAAAEAEAQRSALLRRFGRIGVDRGQQLRDRQPSKRRARRRDPGTRARFIAPFFRRPFSTPVHSSLLNLPSGDCAPLRQRRSTSSRRALPCALATTPVDCHLRFGAARHVNRRRDARAISLWRSMAPRFVAATIHIEALTFSAAAHRAVTAALTWLSAED